MRPTADDNARTVRPGTRSRWRRGWPLAVVAGLVAGLLAFPSAVPNAGPRLGSLVETFLPWLGLVIPVLLGLALLRRSLPALLATLLPAAVWVGLIAPAPAADRETPGTGLTAVQHNVSDENPDPAGTGKALLAVRPDLVALVEVTPAALPAYLAALAPELPHHAVQGTVGLWSRYPLADARPLDIKPSGLAADWRRALRATARTPYGEIAVYVAHLPSVRLGVSTGFGTARRDESAARLGAAIRAERLETVLLLGDLNSTLDDRGLDPVGSQLTSPRTRLPFSWPAGFPVARVDQVMARSATVARVRALPATGSDHLPITARVHLPDG
ncbi:endonuclease/exonuclease/phosphatase family protein [Micromonospora sp. NPDC049559]|uniref:endonuclease/exonuclease/phosphatase family protein n=1 Tax=Micromonospora sp. NPDC049559 TaxID=3155923 RepID=UPI00341207E6